MLLRAGCGLEASAEKQRLLQRATAAARESAVFSEDSGWAAGSLTQGSSPGYYPTWLQAGKALNMDARHHSEVNTKSQSFSQV